MDELGPGYSRIEELKKEERELSNVYTGGDRGFSKMLVHGPDIDERR